MARSWLVVRAADAARGFQTVDIRAKTRKGVRRAAANAARDGQEVIAGYFGGTGPIALAPKVWPY